MAETLILCGGARSPASDGAKTVRLALSGPEQNLDLRIEDISRRMVADVPPVLTDLLEIAAYVYCADQLVSRGGAAMRKLGGGWRRTLRFVIPVREPDRWNAVEIRELLERLLAFMSDETMRFEFIPAARSPAINSYFDFSGDTELSSGAEEVALFSGGMDSLSGVVGMLEKGKTKPILVSHQSSTKIAGHQRHLAELLRERFPGRVLHVPVRISKRGIAAIENTQRSRSFLFAVVALAVARLSGLDGVSFFENGVVSFNLPIAGQVIGARATRSTHPRVIHDLQVFFSALLDTAIRIRNPYIWMTKAEVASRLQDSGHADLNPYSVSCSHPFGMTILKTHCGQCSQCLDRRFAALAADLAGADPHEMYDVDLLVGERTEGTDRTMAENFVRHAQELRGMTELNFLGRFGGHVARAFVGFSHLTAEQVMKKAFDLHQRHGEAVVSVLNKGFQRYTHELAAGSLPQSCLLRLVGGPASIAGAASIRDPTEIKENKEQRSDRRNLRATSEILLAVNNDRREVLIRSIPPVRGPASCALLERLIGVYEQDQSAGRAPENYRYLKSRELAKSLGIEEATLRRRVSRVRKLVAAGFQEKLGLTLTGDAVIQSSQWQGYRLNPSVRIVAVAELRDGADVTASRSHVTAPRLAHEKSGA